MSLVIQLCTNPAWPAFFFGLFIYGHYYFYERRVEERWDRAWGNDTQGAITHIHMDYQMVIAQHWQYSGLLSFLPSLWSPWPHTWSQSQTHLFEPVLLLSYNVLNHHSYWVDPGDHHAQRHHVLNHKQKTEKKPTQSAITHTFFLPHCISNMWDRPNSRYKHHKKNKLIQNDHLTRFKVHFSASLSNDYYYSKGTAFLCNITW